MDIDQNLVTVHALSICYTIDPYSDVVKLTTVKNSKGGAQLNAAGDSLVNTAMAIDDAKLIVIDCFGFRSMSINNYRVHLRIKKPSKAKKVSLTTFKIFSTNRQNFLTEC